MKVVKDATLMVRGYEGHTYMCPGCADIERRFVFNKHGRSTETPAVKREAEEDWR